MNKPHHLFELFWEFFKIGAVTFGGGLAMMPIMRKAVVEHKNWVNDDDILKILVISESTPGVFAVNAATFIGYKIGGFMGALAATLGVIIPSLITISIISFFILQFKELTLVSYAFYGIQVAVGLLIFKAAIKLSKKIHFDAFAWIVLISSILFATFTNINVLYLLLVGAILGIVYGMIENIKEVKKA
ncbi:MAG: hypothetical protein A2Y45_03505 [Tenericutes bacterium GWC2_34_14]|nr:MAG: hypothetical protein A2Z84_07265 [Tenericutes bacterium GWA2_35_7]OHE29200.1 MAG: hypothetical protein A2Y45_03505 [Tenericutes bacterium GWC2_34_14]OHE34283.1 MAG: hypothetical protein A2012_09095 [Tenericutes bacterium GWE2_34_108]OHE35635.1 MAG: hypothetical protein A2Y46_05860 [Tenericutes bacterium GWF1_35_14]OHE38850.1 MAG: hypothetical protein A2Y44_00295 [Tenericutes bacterium GWF2_35_184]OHE43615.1 MAG: hypothetical protein A3K26_00195 [Tenericutes bacterium RIFOXYA12_FULL_35_